MLVPTSVLVNLSPTNSRLITGGLDEKYASAASVSSHAVSRRHNAENVSANPSVLKKDSVQISSEAREVSKLENRDREVRTHEAAHAAVGGQYAGSPSLTYTNGPDGRSYATSGEVAIDLSPVSGDPLATLQKAEVIRSAALAPSQPSAQDMRVASKAAVMAAQARAELATEVEGTAGELSDPDITEQVESISNLDSLNNRAAGSQLAL